MCEKCGCGQSWCVGALLWDCSIGREIRNGVAVRLSLGLEAVKSIQEVLATLLRLLVALAAQEPTWFVFDPVRFSEQDPQC